MMILPVSTLALLSTLTVGSVPETTKPSLTSTPAVANILPADTPIVGLVNTKGESWAKLNRFQLFKTAFTAASQFLPTTFTFDYAKDIESWLGDQVAFAFMPKVGSTTATIDSSFLLVAPIKDDTRLQPFLEKLKTDTPRVTVRQYKGITILEMKEPEVAPPQNTLPSLEMKKPELAPRRNTPPSLELRNRELAPRPKALPSAVRKLKSPSETEFETELLKPNSLTRKRSFAIATFPGYVVTGITAQPIEQLIDASQANNTLAQNPQFQQTFQQSQSDKVLFTIYENFATFVPLINDISKDPSLSVPIFGADKIQLEQVKDYASADGFVSLQPEGLRFQINAHRPIVKSKQNKDNTKKPETILDRMPGATYSAFTGRNLNLQWQQLAKGFSSEPQLKDYLEKFRDFFRSSTGLDFDKDILGWMDGDYGFFSFPTKGGLFKFVSPDFNLGIGLAVQTTNRAAADTTLNKLNELIQSFLAGGVVVNTHNIKGQSVTSWDIGGDSSQSLLAYSWVNDNTVVVTTGFGAIADLVPQPYILLPTTYNFKNATNSLPYPNHGYFYVNMGSLLSWVYGFMPSVFNNEYFQPYKQVLGSVYSISATTSTTTEREQFDILLVLAPTRSK
ncbi:hypothetical protein NIES4103_50670 [Nostoc sp. NIES-4103]|nr:hypothetical protein NIES4103_50670 [Nostoc sp. NIES-4103]